MGVYLTPTMSGSGVQSSPVILYLKESPDGIRLNCCWAYCVRQLFLLARVFPELYRKWDVLRSAN